jgi:hypothetical protein
MDSINKLFNSSTIEVVSGNSCGSLVSKCHITAAQFTAYNPSPLYARHWQLDNSCAVQQAVFQTSRQTQMLMDLVRPSLFPLAITAPKLLPKAASQCLNRGLQFTNLGMDGMQ